MKLSDELITKYFDVPVENIEYSYEKKLTRVFIELPDFVKSSGDMTMRVQIVVEFSLPHETKAFLRTTELYSSWGEGESVMFFMLKHPLKVKPEEAVENVHSNLSVLLMNLANVARLN